MLNKDLIRFWKYDARSLDDISLESALAEVVCHGRLLRTVTLLEPSKYAAAYMTVIMWEVSPEFSYEY